jgi:hypothetical protein
VTERLRAIVDRRLSDVEIRAYLDAPIVDAEREGVLELIRWFSSRYPNPADRLAYARRAYARWAGRVYSPLRTSTP